MNKLYIYTYVNMENKNNLILEEEEVWMGVNVPVILMKQSIRYNSIKYFIILQMAGGGDPKWQKDAADQNFDYMFKLLIIGNSSVGKTRYVTLL